MKTDATQATVLAFEEMAFLDVSAGKPPHPGAREDGPWLFLSYSSPQAGALALFLPKAVKFSVAEAIYAEDTHQITPAQLDDGLLELLNVLAGRLLSERFGASQPYTMGLPVVLYDPPGDLAGMERREFFFHMDENEITLWWYEVAQ